MSVAVTSLPVPLSPLMSTVLSLGPMTRRNSKTARIRGLRLTIRASIIRASHQPKRAELGDGVAKRGFDAEVERHLRARTGRAHARQSHVRGIPRHLDELDVAAVGP